MDVNEAVRFYGGLHSEWRELKNGAVAHEDSVIGNRVQIEGPAVFRSGEFYGGLYRGGEFHGGLYRGGYYNAGTFRDSVVHDGVFMGGIFVGCEIYDGNFSYCTLKGGTYRYGFYRAGKFTKSVCLLGVGNSTINICSPNQICIRANAQCVFYNIESPLPSLKGQLAELGVRKEDWKQIKRAVKLLLSLPKDSWPDEYWTPHGDQDDQQRPEG